MTVARLRNIAGWTLTLLASAAVILALVPLNGAKSGLVSTVITSGTSMNPRLVQGDLVIAVRTHDWHIGDTVIFLAKDGDHITKVAHRLIAGNAVDGWQTKGDNREFPDLGGQPLADSDILGEEMFFIPGLGEKLLWLRSPLFVIVMCAVAVLWLVFRFLGEDDDTDDIAEDRAAPPVPVA